MFKTVVILFLLFSIFHLRSYSEEDLDYDYLNSLKIEAGHNFQRLNSIETESKNRKIFDNEREKSLGLYLEEQENWDLNREKGLAEYRRSLKAKTNPEDSAEFRLDQQQKQNELAQKEKNRKIHIKTKNQVLQKNSELITQLEKKEFGLEDHRPRYELRRRGQNKWVKSGQTSKSSASGFTPSSNDSDNGYIPPPSNDFIPAPPMGDSYDDIPPPPPPPTNYDYGGSGMSFDSGYGGDIPPPPPPPPMPDYDF